MRITPRTYLHTFAFIVMGLGLLKLTTDIEHFSWPKFGSSVQTDSIPTDSIALENEASAPVDQAEPAPVAEHAEWKDEVFHHPILSVPNYSTAFPDENDVQLAMAKKYGVSPVTNRNEAESRKSELVFIGASPYFTVDRLRSSIPYLVPSAAVLLQDIGKTYYDSLVMKGVPLHRIITTSVLRTKEDVARLRAHNPNATENSCHLYGTTFDIAQNRFVTVEDPDGPHRRQVTNDTLKWILSEVLRDMREKGRCYVKYERKQGCFHITVR